MKNQKLFTIPFLIILLLYGCSNSKKGLYDSKAIEALDNLTATIGDLKSISYSLSTDVAEKKEGDLKSVHKQSDVYLRGPDKMLVYTEKDSVRKAYYYDGSKLSVFRFNERTYESISAPTTIMATIDSVHAKYGVDFPGIDLFYPTLTDDMMAQFDTIVVSRSTIVDGVACKEINAVNANSDVYLSISDSTHLPKKLEIYYLGDKKGEYYVVTYSNLRTNPELPDELFQFSPPANAIKTSLLTQNLDQ